jgi:enoyl-CoA hydratase/carnithine racemase
MDGSQPILIEQHGGAGWIRINRPDRRNAIDQVTRADLARAFTELQRDDDIRVIVLTGTGSAFCAGVDLGDTSSQTKPFHLGTRLVHPVETCEIPVIAAVNGAAVGGGFELALAADLRLASESAFFQLTELHLGSLPGSGGTQRLFTSLPQAVAWKALATGSKISSEEALRFGLVSDRFPDETFHADVAEIVAKIAAAAPLSLRAAKLAARAATDDRLSTGMRLERSLWSALSGTEDRAEGRAAFREKRKPDFKGR